MDKSFVLSSTRECDGTEQVHGAASSMVTRIMAAVILLGGVAGCAGEMPQPHYAAKAATNLNELKMVSADDLATRRGGFSYAGIDINFGAVVRTVVNGTLVLETQFTSTPLGLVATQSGPATTSNTPIVGSPDLNVSLLDGSSQSNGHITQINLGSSTFQNVKGVVISGPSGVSTALSSVSSLQIANAVLSNAVGQAVSQQIEVNIALSNFGSVQQQIAANQINTRVASAVQTALAASIPH